MTTQPTFTPSPFASTFRQVGPVLVVAAGIVGGVAWSLGTDTSLTAAPPFLVTQGVLVFAALLVAARGVPRWSYPWLAFGIGGAHYLLRFVLLPESSDGELPSVALLALASVAGLVLALLMAALIAARRWSDAAMFMAFYLVSTGLGLPSLRQPPEGPIVSIEATRLALLAVQTVMAGVAILLWNQRVTIPAVALLGVLLLLMPLALGVLLPRSQTELPEDYTLAWLLWDFVRLYLVVAIFTFAAGAVRRVLGGQGILSGRVAMGKQPAGPAPS